MKLLKILQYGHPLLREKARDVKSVGSREKDLIATMIETMYDARGIGLAATQVGVMERLFVVDVDQREQDEDASPEEAHRFRNPLVFINPEIVWESDEDETFEEGCLSIPTVKGEIYRPSAVRIVARDQNFEEFAVNADELLARVIQHEYDHLNGVLFTDHLPRTSRVLLSGRLGKLQRETLAALPEMPESYPVEYELKEEQ